MQMQIRELLKPTDFEFYVKRPKPAGRTPQRDSPEQLLKALNKAHGNIRQLVTENDRIRLASLKLDARQRLQLKIFLALMGVTWSVVGWALKLLIPYAIHGMAK